MGKQYTLKYTGGIFSREELQAEGAGGCDALVLISILRENPDAPHDGAKSFAVVTADGANPGQEIPATELFQAFVRLSMELIERKDELPKWQSDLAIDVRKYVQDIVGKIALSNEGAHDF